MDPTQALADLLDAIREADGDRYEESLEALLEWHRKGGAMPAATHNVERLALVHAETVRDQLLEYGMTGESDLRVRAAENVCRALARLLARDAPAIILNT